jgi:Flagellar transcriptional activator (FlhC)
MRITDSRYDRDRLRLSLAYRLIGYEARTHTIQHCTGLSADRIRKLFRDYVRTQPDLPIRRRRGKSPRQMEFFRRSAALEMEAATVASLLRAFALLTCPALLQRPTLDEVARFCDAYDTFRCLCPTTSISFEHAWYLRHALAQHDEYELAHCPDCRGLWVRDRLDVSPGTCPACRWPEASLPASLPVEVAHGC